MALELRYTWVGILINPHYNALKTIYLHTCRVCIIYLHTTTRLHIGINEYLSMEHNT